jgi:hypothetical protein
MGAGASSRLHSLASDHLYHASEQKKESVVIDPPLHHHRVGRQSESGEIGIDPQAVPKNEINNHASASATGSISATRSEEEVVAQITMEVNRMIMKCNVPLLKNSSQGNLNLYTYS